MRSEKLILQINAQDSVEVLQVPPIQANSLQQSAELRFTMVNKRNSSKVCLGDYQNNTQPVILGCRESLGEMLRSKLCKQVPPCALSHSLSKSELFMTCHSPNQSLKPCPNSNKYLCIQVTTCPTKKGLYYHKWSSIKCHGNSKTVCVGKFYPHTLFKL